MWALVRAALCPLHIEDQKPTEQQEDLLLPPPPEAEPAEPVIPKAPLLEEIFPDPRPLMWESSSTRSSVMGSYVRTGFIGPKGLRIFLILGGVLGSTAMILLYYAFQATSLADAMVIAFSCPVFTSIFACIFLKEKYSLWNVLFTAFAITGVILIVRPPFVFGSNTVKMTRSYSDHLKGTLAALGHAVSNALTLVILRKMGKSVDYFLPIWFYVLVGLVECVIILSVFGMWRLPNCGMDRLFLLLIGLFGLGGQVFLTKALQIEEAGLVALMKTMDVVFAFIFQIIFLHNIPTWWTVGGALCVVASSAGAAIRKWCQGSK
ncbi:PREDICTED: solute carrier family 35 member G1-like [Myotis davidii]|uniref:solute carrier family 35 member G1-like n=1 Tax=Myotis davidii TaxID=225400 RepID=UPI0007672E6F|nr:PREDICTED: solute carrier family 35 member G1-like [Myotis davidii]